MTKSSKRAQSGLAMVAVLVMMIAISLFGVAVMNMSGLEQRIAGNFQLVAESFEVSEAGLRGAISLSEGTNDPFQGPGATLGTYVLVEDPSQTDTHKVNPFYGENPISSIYGESGLNIALHLVGVERPCPRSTNPTSTSISSCDYYRLDSFHENDSTGVETGVAIQVVEEVTESN